MDKKKCIHCLTPFDKHLGLSGTCEKLQKARGTLKVLSTLLTFRGGIEFDEKHALKIITNTLKETK